MLEPRADQLVRVRQLLEVACAAVGGVYEPANADRPTGVPFSEERPLWTTAALAQDARPALAAIGAYVWRSAPLQRALELQGAVGIAELLTELEAGGVCLSELDGGGAAQRLLAANAANGQLSRASLELLLLRPAAGCGQAAVALRQIAESCTPLAEAQLPEYTGEAAAEAAAAAEEAAAELEGRAGSSGGMLRADGLDFLMGEEDGGDGDGAVGARTDWWSSADTLGGLKRDAHAGAAPIRRPRYPPPPCPTRLRLAAELVEARSDADVLARLCSEEQRTRRGRARARMEAAADAPAARCA
jgi:hypothetical protein